MKLNVIDLFAGCGGLSKGFMDVGFKVLIGVDNDPVALETFKYNHDNAITLNTDLSKNEAFDELDNAINVNTVDLVIAGPPCQGFSLTGPRNIDDKRNSLYLAVIKAVRKYNPKAFVVENVPGMATLYRGEILKEVIHRFTKIGYNVDSKVLCAADYGVPQMRKRLIIIGVRKDIGNPLFPEPVVSSDNYVSCSDAISDLPAREPQDDNREWYGKEVDKYTLEPFTTYQQNMRKNCNVLYNHVATKHKQFVIDTIAQVPEGGNYKSLPPGVGESRKFNEAWTRYHSNKPSKTIDTGHRNHFHYKYNRVPTIRENARLQSFPDDFVFFGSRTQQNRQVGNAVPPLLGYHIGLAIKPLLEQDKENSDD